jgi:hypothetical protein
MPRAEFKPAIPAIKRPQTYALDREATGNGVLIHPSEFNVENGSHFSHWSIIYA